MQEYDLVRRMYHHDNLSRREISCRTGIHRKTINKMLRYSSPPGYRLKKPRSKTKLDPFIPIIDQILESDREAPRKQRHTARRILDRLRDEHGFTGSYTIVKDYVRDKLIRMKEVYFPLEQKPGTSQTDFGKAKVYIAGRLLEAHFFVMGLAFSDAVFAKAFPTEAFEAVADGHVSAYRFLDGVPPVNLLDNMSTAVKKVLRGRGRLLTDGFLALRSHYLFRSHFTNVRRPNEKGVVEGLVGFVRRNFLTPVPRFESWDALNAYLEECCRRRLSDKVAGKDRSIGALLEEERSTFLPLPAYEFDACQSEQRRATSQSLVKFQSASYSVPIEYAHREVTIKAYPFRLEVCHKDERIASHQRSFERDDFVFDPRHYLPLLERKPGALDGAAPFAGWELPGCFETLRRFLEARSGVGGKREYIQVLQLLRDFRVPEVRRAIEKAFDCGAACFDSIKMIVMTGREPAFEVVRLSDEKLSAFPRICVESTQHSRYGALLSGGVS